MNSIIPVHGDLRLAGNIAADQNNVSFPLNPKIGTIIVRGINLYVFIEVGGVQTWYPLVSLSGNVFQHIENIANTEWLVTHNLNTAEYWYQAQDLAGNIIVPTNITPIDANSFIATFPIAIAGNIVIVATSNMVVDRVFTNLINVGADVIIDVAGMLIGGKRVLTGGVTKIVDGTGKEIFFTDQTPLRLIAGSGVTLEFNDFDKSVKINSEPITNKSHLGLDAVENIAPLDMPVSILQAQADAVVLDDAKTYADMLLNDITVSASVVAMEASNRAAAIVAAIEAERIIITGEIAAAISHEVTVRDEAIAIEANIRKSADDAIMLSIGNGIADTNNNLNAFNLSLTDAIVTEVSNRNAAILVETNARIADVNQEATDRDTAISTAISVLKGTAPVARDTLGELSTAIDSESTNRTNAITAEVAARDAAITVETTNRVAADALLVPKTTTINGKALDGNITLVKADVGLSNVDNTSDVNKPVSTAQATADIAVQDAAALDATTKANAAQTAAIAASVPSTHVGSSGAAHAVATTTVAGFMSSTDKVKLNGVSGSNTGDETTATIKTKLGITTLSGNNTGDQTTVSGNSGTATKLETARNINGVSFDGSVDITINAVDSTARVASSLLGAADGVATLDANGKVPSTQLPSFVDDVLEYANLASFPATGETGKIYVSLANNKTYRWSGSVYVYITSGAVDSVAGKTGVVTLVKADVGLGNVDNTSDANKPVSTLQQAAIDAAVISANGAIPTNISAFTNDSGYQTLAQLNTAISNLVGTAPVGLDTLGEIATDLGTKVNASALATVATTGKYSDLLNKPTLSTVAGTGSYSDLLNKPTIPVVPTNISSFTNDSTYQTSTQVAASILVETNARIADVNQEVTDRDAAIATAVSNLVGTASAARNTLGELSTAIDTEATSRDTAINSVMTAVNNKANLTTNKFSGRQSLTSFFITSVSGAISINVLNGNVQKITLMGAATFSLTGWDTANVFSEVLLELGNGGNVGITWPTIKWLLPTTGATAVSFSAYLTAIGRTSGALQVSGIDFIYLWSTDGGVTIYGKVL